MGYYNLPTSAQPPELSEFEKLLRTLPPEGAMAALDLLETLSRNVLQNPGEEKFRRVRTTNAKLAPLFSQPPAEAIMEAMGWCRDGDCMVLPPGVQLDFQQHPVKILEAKSYFGKQREVASRAARLTPDPSKATSLKQLEMERRERAGVEASVATPSPTAAAAAQPALAESAPGVPVPTVPAPSVAAVPSGPAPTTEHTPAGENGHVKKSAFDFERRGEAEKNRKESELSLQELRALQKERFKEHQADPHAKDSEAYKRPPSVANGGSTKDGWMDWFWGGSASSSSGGGGGGGGGGPAPGGSRTKTLRDLPPPPRKGGG